MIDNTALLSELYSIQESYSVEQTAIDQTDKRCIIDVKERTINIPVEIESLGVQYDHRSYKLLFEIDRYIHGVDLLTQTCVIQWLSKNGTAERSGLHPVVEIEAIDNDKLLFVWELYEDETRIPGTILFAVNFYTMKDENSFLWSYNTLPASSTIKDTLDVVINPSDEITPSLLMVWNDKMTSIERLAHDSVSTSIKSAQEAEAWAHGRADFPNTMLDNAKYYKDLTQALYDEAKDVLSEEKDKVVEEAKAEIIDLAKDEVIAVAKEEVTNDVINDVYTVKNESITAINDTTTSAIQEVEQSRNNAINDLLSTGDQRYAVKGSIPTKVSELENDSKYLTEVPEAPVKSVNSKTGEVKLSAEDIGAVASEEFAEFKIDYDNHSHTAEEIGAATSEEVIQLKDDLGALDEKVKNLPTDDPGDVSWNDLTDRPFYEGATDTVVFERIEDIFGVALTFCNKTPFEIVEGDIYIITINGDTFECTGKKEELIYCGENHTCSYIGNVSLSPGFSTVEGTGEPFSYYYIHEDNGIVSNVSMHIDNNIYKGGTISIIHRAYEVKTLDPKYLPIMYKDKASGGEVIFPETTSVDSSGFESDEDAIASGATFFHMIEEFEEGVECYGCIINPLRFEKGVEYTINWNGVSYKCTPIFAADGSNGDGTFNSLVALGNVGIIAGGDDNGEPFVIFCDEYDMTNGGRFEIGILDNITPVTLSITKGDVGEEKYLIDPKYIPNMYYEEECKGEIFPLTKAVTEDQMTESDTLIYLPDDGVFIIVPSVVLDIVEGETYIVSLNGEEYSCKATSLEIEPGSGVYAICLGDVYTFSGGTVGTASTGEPFVIAVVPPEFIEDFGASVSCMLLMDPPEEITFGIFSGGSKIHKIPEKYLPSISFNNLTDKPFYEETSKKLVLPKTTVVMKGSPGHSSGETNVYVELVPGNTYEIYYNGDLYTLVAKRFVQENVDVIYIGNFAIFEYVTGLSTDKAEDAKEPFVIVNYTGVTTIIEYNELGSAYSGEIALSIIEVNNVVKTLDPKYIKDMYYEATEDVVVFEVFDDIEGENVGIVRDCYKTTFLNTVCKLVEGETYTITINGVRFVSNCYKEQEASGVVVMAIGNSSLADESSWNVRPTSNPFLLRSLISTTDDTVGEVYLNISRDFRNSISIQSCPIVVTRKEEVVHPIKSKYLPMDEITSAVIAALPKYEGEVTEV